MSEANMSRIKVLSVNMDGANMSGADLSRANIQGSEMNRVNLQGANLTEAALYNNSLTNANLSGANLSGAHLSGTNLKNANLNGANLSGADLSDVDLTGAKLKDTILTGIKTNRGTISNNEYFLSFLKEESKKKAKEKKRLAKVQASQNRKDELGLFYQSYAGLKKCYEARKGYALVHVSSVEMAKFKSKAKSIENGIFDKFPEVKPMKDKIWNKFTKTIGGIYFRYVGETFSGQFFAGVPEVTSNLSDWQGVCDHFKPIYNKLIRKYGGGSTTEKDF
jgi:hypothetical protein